MRGRSRAARPAWGPRWLACAIAVVAAVALLTAACGGDDDGGSPGAASTPATTLASGGLTTDTACADWLAASADAKAEALASTAAFNEGGINAFIAETRRLLAASPDAAATVPDTVPVDEGVALVDDSCAAVAPDDTVAQAIPAYAYANGQGATTAP